MFFPDVVVQIVKKLILIRNPLARARHKEMWIKWKRVALPPLDVTRKHTNFIVDIHSINATILLSLILKLLLQRFNTDNFYKTEGCHVGPGGHIAPDTCDLWVLEDHPQPPPPPPAPANLPWSNTFLTSCVFAYSCCLHGFFSSNYWLSLLFMPNVFLVSLRPAPKSFTHGNTTINVASSFKFSRTSATASPILSEAFAR